MGLGRRLRSAWAALPGWARWVLAVYLIGFADGTAAHARDLARAGFHAYSGFPQVPLRVFFISLVLLDPLVVVLAALVLPAGIWLAAVVMVLDVAANTAGNWSRIQRDPAWPFTRVRPAAHHRVRRVRARHRPRHAPRHQRSLQDRAGFSAENRGLYRTINQAACGRTCPGPV